MDERLSTEGTGHQSRRTLIIAGIVFLLLISLSFAIGFTLGRRNNPPPIIIQTSSTP